MALQDTLDSPLAKAVRKAGSQARYAAIVGKTQPTIFHALKCGHEIDLEDVPAIEKALGIPRHELRPDYFEAPIPARQSAEQPPEPTPRPGSPQGSGGPISGDAAEGIAA